GRGDAAAGRGRRTGRGCGGRGRARIRRGGTPGRAARRVALSTALSTGCGNRDKFVAKSGGFSPANVGLLCEHTFYVPCKQASKRRAPTGSPTGGAGERPRL